MEPPVVVLVGTSHPGNAGAAARGAANFGVTDLRFVAPRCDVRSKEALDRARHADRLLAGAPAFATLDEALAGTSLAVGTTARTTVAGHRFARKTLDVRDWAQGMVEWEGQVALVFGREDDGLHAAEVERMDQLVTVPTADYASLNLAHAVTLLCYEHFLARNEARITVDRHLAPDMLRAMTKAWDDLVDAVETRPWRKQVSRGVFRKVVGRSLPDDHEVHNVMGILSGALRRFDHPDYRTRKSSRVLRGRGLLAEPAMHARAARARGGAGARRTDVTGEEE